MPITALDIKDKTFNLKFRGYSEEEVNEFLDILVDDFEELTRTNREQLVKIKALEEKLAYFDDMKESLSQSVILAQETAEKLKSSARAEAENILTKADNEATYLLEESKQRANDMLREAAEESKRVSIETEGLKRQTRVFHQRLLSSMEGHLALVNSPEWDELLQPTASYVQSADKAFKEVVSTIQDESAASDDTSSSNDEPNLAEDGDDTTRQFSSEEMAELQRRVEESNRQLEETIAGQAPFLTDELLSDLEEELRSETESTNFNETQTFKLNIED